MFKILLLSQHFHNKMSCIMRKQAFEICKNKDVDQHLCFSFTDSAIVNSLRVYSVIPIGNPEDSFSQHPAQI